ncbi:MAG: glycosyltransferase [Verrucomicrobia bacterium]|nr:glycosyltransferase [Verrucomicrobiota bacterium]
MKGKGKIFISVVIPTYERPNDLRVCLHSLKEEFQVDSPNYEIIVTDDSKSHISRRMVEREFPDVSWGKGKQIGPAGNRNAGVSRATGEWIVFIDDDCIADQRYISAYCNAILQNPETVLFEGKIYPDRPRRTWAECCPENSNGGMFWTSNLCVKKSTFLEIGGFDERFRVAYEDIDFAYRIKSKGFKSKFIKNASVCHPWRTLKNEGNNWKPKGFEISELILFIKKHPSAKEHNSRLVYVRHLKRMMTMDLLKCLFQYKGKGIQTLISQIMTTILIIRKL